MRLRVGRRCSAIVQTLMQVTCGLLVFVVVLLVSLESCRLLIIVRCIVKEVSSERELLLSGLCATVSRAQAHRALR